MQRVSRLLAIIAAVAAPATLYGQKSSSAGGSPLTAGAFVLGTTFTPVSVGGAAGPTIGVAITTGSGSSATTIGLNGSMGWMLNSSLDLGADLNVASLSGGGTSLTAYQVGPYVRGWFGATESGAWNLGARVSIFNTSPGSNSTTIFGVFGGYSFFVNSGLAINLTLPVTIGTGGGSSTTTFGLGVGLTGFIH